MRDLFIGFVGGAIVTALFLVAEALLKKIMPIDKSGSKESVAMPIPDELEKLVRQAYGEAPTIDEQFRTLTGRWKKETAHYSKISQVAEHPAYRQIVEMGDSVVQLILQDLKQNGGRWSQTLREITKKNPVTPDIRGNVEEIKEAWLKWGRDNGYSV